MRWIGALAASLTVVTACMDPETDAAPATEPATEQATALIDEDVTVVDVSLAEGGVTLSNDSIPAGTVAFQLRNGGGAPQTFAVKGTGGGGEWSSDPLAPGGTVTMSLNLPPGIYEVHSAGTAAGGSAAAGQRTRLRVY